jgi:pSer/pThr/pTyr-binding forkhead associated (FHA) protein
MKIAASRPRDGAGAKKVESEPGRLCGWLVSYSDPQGAAVELREGKFFVSRSSLKPTDLIVEEESISTPHALITVIGGSALQVQDLMSERGVFVRRRGGDTYQRIEENVAAEHGDWLRFGDVEFLVSMIAQVGATGE